jgi:putative membrane protein
MWAGFADLRLASVAVVLGVVMELLPQGGPDAARLAERLTGVAGAAVVVALVTGTWIVGVATSVLRRFGFRLTRTAQGLVAEHGLLNRRRTELRATKVQLLTWLEPLVLRTVGFGSLQIETAAARETGSGTERSEAVVPIVDPEEARGVVRAALGTALDPTTLPLSPPHRWAALRTTGTILAQLAAATAIAGAVFGPWGLVLVALWPVAVWGGLRDVAGQGYALVERLVVARRGWWVRRTAVLDRRKVQSATVIQSPLLRWAGVGLLVVRVAGSRVLLPLLAIEDAVVLADRLVGPDPVPAAPEVTPVG